MQHNSEAKGGDQQNSFFNFQDTDPIRFQKIKMSSTTTTMARSLAIKEGHQSPTSSAVKAVPKAVTPSPVASSKPKVKFQPEQVITVAASLPKLKPEQFSGDKGNINRKGPSTSAAAAAKDKKKMFGGTPSRLSNQLALMAEGQRLSQSSPSSSSEKRQCPTPDLVDSSSPSSAVSLAAAAAAATAASSSAQEPPKKKKRSLSSTRPWTGRDNQILYLCQATIGNQWSQIFRLLTDRSPNALKNRYHSEKFQDDLKREASWMKDIPDDVRALVREHCTKVEAEKKLTGTYKREKNLPVPGGACGASCTTSTSSTGGGDIATTTSSRPPSVPKPRAPSAPPRRASIDVDDDAPLPPVTATVTVAPPLIAGYAPAGFRPKSPKKGAVRKPFGVASTHRNAVTRPRLSPSVLQPSGKAVRAETNPTGPAVKGQNNESAVTGGARASVPRAMPPPPARTNGHLAAQAGRQKRSNRFPVQMVFPLENSLPSLPFTHALEEAFWSPYVATLPPTPSCTGMNSPTKQSP
mmetsp:Transcript_36394/g.79217  ORF Transcript_36394/g.79217 Transcript_36394/m.79217 type:complete len:522 (+) Transcript_36394:494-2059(+)